MINDCWIHGQTDLKVRTTLHHRWLSALSHLGAGFLRKPHILGF